MSSVYILPRSHQTAAFVSAQTAAPFRQQGQRPQSARLVRTTGSGRIIPQNRMAPTMNTARRLYLAPIITTPMQSHPAQPIPATEPTQFVSLQPMQAENYSAGNKATTQTHFFPQQKVLTSPNQQQLSEEDNEFDVDEGYRLLEESAGHRMNEMLIAPRRRERLSNLTVEQKMDRRKQKNRIAAQAARDRKKETTKRLEQSLKHAIQEIGRLRSEVKWLRAENIELRNPQNGGKEAEQHETIARQQYQLQTNPMQFQPKQEVMAMEQHPQQQIRSLHPLPPSNIQYAVYPHQQAKNNYKLRELKSEAFSPMMSQLVPMSNQQIATKSQQQQHPSASTVVNANTRRTPLLAPGNDSLGSAASFNAPLPWEWESVQEKEVAELEQMQQHKTSSNSKMELLATTIALVPNSYNRMMMATSGGRKQQQAVRMTCMIKILTALWSVICTKGGTALMGKTAASCSKSSTNFLKNWTFQSMWTASATRSLKKALLRRMKRMDSAKLQRLCNYPQKQLVSQLLMRQTRDSINKARGRQRIVPTASIRTSSTLEAILTTNTTPLQNCTSLSSEEEQDELSNSAVVTTSEQNYNVPQQQWRH